MEVILICIAVATVALSTASYFHRSRQRIFLTKTLKVDEPLRKRVARELGVDGAVVTGVSVFDVLYNTMKLDPNALRGMDHLHHAKDFQNLGELMALVHENCRGRVAPCLVCFRLPWLSDRTRA